MKYHILTTYMPLAGTFRLACLIVFRRGRRELEAWQCPLGIEVICQISPAQYDPL